MSSMLLTKPKEQTAALPETPQGQINRFMNAIKMEYKSSEIEKHLMKKNPVPNDQEWDTGLFDCFDDPDSCKTGLFCPCVLHGKNMETLRDIPWKFGCALHSASMLTNIALASSLVMFHGAMGISAVVSMAECLTVCCFLSTTFLGSNRFRMQNQYHLKNTPCNCDDFFTHCFAHCCAICQEHREMKKRINDRSDKTNAVTVPPPRQQMSMDKEEAVQNAN